MIKRYLLRYLQHVWKRSFLHWYIWTRFIRGRLVSNNMRRLLHVMSRASTLHHPVAAISLDAEKAFDRIEWPFLFHTLTKFGFGPICMQWIKAMYYQPTARVKTNGMISHPFQLFRSTRQSCPVSPFFFFLALKPLACAIRTNKNITSINLSEYDFKASLYADDILLTLSNPMYSMYTIPSVKTYRKIWSIIRI